MSVAGVAGREAQPDPEPGGVLRTVRGDVSAADMGVTLPHEHLLCDSRTWLQPPKDALGDAMALQSPRLDNLWWMRQFPNSNPDVLVLDDETVAVAELRPFVQAGGRTVIELTPRELGRDVRRLAAIAAAADVHVVAATGHYIAPAHAPTVARASEQELADEMVAEIESGVDDTGIRCGVLGEIGLSWPVHPDERKALRAAALAQQRTGAAISVHTAAHAVEADSALVAADELERGGADLGRVVMGHMDTTLHRPDYHRRVLERGCLLEFDLFGHEFFESENGFQSFGDTETVRAAARLVADGWAHRLLFSHDVCYKIQLQRWGGYGYAHLLRNIVPRLQLVGVDEAAIRTILVDSPRAVFSIPAPTFPGWRRHLRPSQEA